MTDLDAIIEQCWQDSGRWFGVNHRILSNDELQINFLVIATAGEAGEALNKWKKYLRGSLTFGDMIDELDEEMIDAFIYLCNYFKVRKMNVGEAYARKREFNQRRFGRNTDAALPSAGPDPV
jgi:NTP pyrophosphatase (non-canonical NTP hydrolase)